MIKTYGGSVQAVAAIIKIYISLKVFVVYVCSTRSFQKVIRQVMRSNFLSSLMIVSRFNYCNIVYSNNFSFPVLIYNNKKL